MQGTADVRAPVVDKMQENGKKKKKKRKSQSLNNTLKKTFSLFIFREIRWGLFVCLFFNRRIQCYPELLLPIRLKERSFLKAVCHRIHLCLVAKPESHGACLFILEVLRYQTFVGFSDQFPLQLLFSIIVSWKHLTRTRVLHIFHGHISLPY